MQASLSVESTHFLSEDRDQDTRQSLYTTRLQCAELSHSTSYQPVWQNKSYSIALAINVMDARDRIIAFFRFTLGNAPS